MSISIKDIARAAGVSHSTVSRALRGSPLISPETRARIARLAREMGYSPDAQARSLVIGRTMTIGVVFTTLTDPFIAQVVQSIEDTAHLAGYSVILAGSGSEPEREMAAVQMLRSKRVDGVIVTSSRVGPLYQRHLERLGVPVVLVNSHNEQLAAPVPSAREGPGGGTGAHYTLSVSVDNEHGGWLATRHLLDLDHRRIAYISRTARCLAASQDWIGARNGHSDDLQRLAGYRRALAESDLPPGSELVVPGSGDASGGESALPDLLRLPAPPTAVFCYNDMTAIGVLRAARMAGLRVPADLAVVGFDNIPFARYVHPRLTTIAQPMSEMGRRAVEMVLDLAEPAAALGHTLVRGQLIVRESSEDLRRGGIAALAGREPNQPT